MVKKWSKNHQLKARKINDYYIDYPKNRSPRVRFRDPKTGKFLNNIRISIYELNSLLSSPITI